MKADDCVIDRENVVEDRRGYALYFSLSQAASQLFVYSNKVLAANGTSITYDNGGSGANYTGSYAAPTGKRFRAVEAFQNLYVTSSQGVEVFTDVAGTAARAAGSPRPLDIVATLGASSFSLSGVLAYGNQCAYRSVIKRTDANGNVIFSYPSNRTIVTNNTAFLSTTGNTHSNTTLDTLASTTGVSVGMTVSGTGIPSGTTVSSVNSSTQVTLSQAATATATGVTITFTGASNPSLKCYLPAEASTSDLIQVYRTNTTTQYTSTSDPGEEMALVYQINPTSTDITNGYISLAPDLLIDALRGASLYTSPSQSSMAYANERPPLCKDIALYKNRFMVYANTSTKQRLTLALISAGSLSGRTVTLAGTTYSFSSTENTATGQAAVGSTGIVAADIESTARSLVKVINQYASNTSVYAYYTSGPNDPPGKIMVEERGVGASAFTLQAGDSTISGQFSPQPPVSPATSVLCTSSNQVQKNFLYYSQDQQPEAVPLLNALPVGPANKEILRIFPLRNSLIIVKEEGVYRMTGDGPPFTIMPLDLTVFCKSPDSVAALANAGYMLSNQGIVQITESAVQVISRDIDNLVRPLLQNANISTLPCAVSYESDRAYLISVPTLSSDTQNTQTFRFNVFTRAWSRWSFGFNAAIVEPGADKLYFTKPGDVNLYRERKSFTDNDFADPEKSITITGLVSATNTVVFTASGFTPLPGWVIQQGGVNLAIKTVGGNLGTFTAIMQASLPSAWVTGSATLFPSVGMDVVWAPWTGQGSAAMLKQIAEAVILSDSIPGNNSATAVVPTFSSDFSVDLEEQPYYMPGAGWGADAWGGFWGGVGDVFGYRVLVPRNKQFCARINVGVRHKNALEKLSCTGFAVNYEMLSGVVGR